jgi:hypothetical protein
MRRKKRSKIPPKVFPYIFLCELLKFLASPSHVTCKNKIKRNLILSVKSHGGISIFET